MYKIIEPPFYQSPKTMSRFMADQYFDWFLTQIPIRTTLLIDVILQEEEFAHWEPDMSYESLKLLGKWLSTQSERRPRTDDEILELTEEYDSRRLVMYGIDSSTLTEKTISLSIDIGMYCGEVLISNIIGTQWKLHTPKEKHEVEYQQPIISGFKSGYICNPVMIAKSVASTFSWGQPDTHVLYERFITWAEVADSDR